MMLSSLLSPVLETPVHPVPALADVLIVKVGGARGLDYARCADDLARLNRPLVLVHGVSGMMDALCAERGIPVRTLTSPTGHTSRYTDPAVRDTFVTACERVTAEWVRLLRERGIAAHGLTGDAVPITGERKTAIRAVVEGRVRIVRDDYSGAITGVEADALAAVLVTGAVAVVPPLARSADGLLNIDGDRAGAAVAGALHAADYVILSGVRGLYRQFPDESTFIPRVPANAIDAALTYAEGRMKRKVIGAAEALAAGVRRVVIGDGRAAFPVTAALDGAGTEFHR